MSRSTNPALFHLIPLNDIALEALQHPDNSRFVSNGPDGRLGLEVGFHVAKVPSRVMARLGRNADLILPQRNVSGVHVSLELHPETHVVLLSTRSKRASSVAVAVAAKEVAKPGEASLPAPEPVPPPGDTVEGDCVLSYGVNYTVTIALHHFQLIWRDKKALKLRRQAIEEYEAAMKRQAQGNVRSRFLPTEPDSEAQTWHNTRLHTIKPPPVKETNAMPRVYIGGGTFGTVFRVAEDINGHALAVKVIHLNKFRNSERARAMAHREISALQRLKHKNIIECLGSAQWDTDDPEFFMPLRIGSLLGLVDAPTRNKVELSDNALSLAVLEQMLSALDYLDCHDMCHRDVKPDNIVYYWLRGVGGEKVWTFQLADFGLANFRQHAQTHCGTEIYMAPEIRDGTFDQSHKVDVWSLFATIAHISDEHRFPPLEGQNYHRHILPAIRAAALKAPRLAPMVRENPDYRSSAAQMLVAIFDGHGLTTPRAKVKPIPELPIVPPPVPTPNAPVRAPAPASPASQLVKYPPRKPRKLPQPQDTGAGNAALRPRGEAGITKGRSRKPSSPWPNRFADPKSPAGPSRPLQPQPQPVQAFGNGGPQPNNIAGGGFGLVAQMPGWTPLGTPLDLGPSPPRNFRPRPDPTQLPGGGVEEPVVRDEKRRDPPGSAMPGTFPD